MIYFMKNREDCQNILQQELIFYPQLASKGLVFAAESNTFAERFNELFKLFIPAEQQEIIISELVETLDKS